jgi:hypothetical protein
MTFLIGEENVTNEKQQTANAFNAERGQPTVELRIVGKFKRKDLQQALHEVGGWLEREHVNEDDENIVSFRVPVSNVARTYNAIVSMFGELILEPKWWLEQLQDLLDANAKDLGRAPYASAPMTPAIYPG